MTPIRDTQNWGITTYILSGCYHVSWLFNRISNIALSLVRYAGWTYTSHSPSANRQSRWHYAQGGRYQIDERVRNYARDLFRLEIPQETSLGSISSKCHAASLSYLATGSPELTWAVCQAQEIYGALQGPEVTYIGNPAQAPQELLPPVVGRGLIITQPKVVQFDVDHFCAHLMGIEITEILACEEAKGVVLDRLEHLQEGQYLVTLGNHTIALRVEATKTTLFDINTAAVEIPQGRLRQAVSSICPWFNSQIPCSLYKVQKMAVDPLLLQDTTL